jgi:Fe-S-cluster containining protein
MTTSCRPGCGACCIAPSIATPFPGMPRGKPAGVRCAHLTADNRCALFAHPDRPRFCRKLCPSPAMCGDSAAAALRILADLEEQTRP